MEIALSGGGILGIAHVGALSVVEAQLGANFRIAKMVGASAGAVVGTLYAVGYNSAEIQNIYMSMNIQELIESGDPEWYNILFNNGEYQATAFEAEIENLIAAKTGISNCTFAQLDIDLTLISINVNQQLVLQMNKINTPDLVISKATRMSFSIPITLTPVLYEGNLYIDGSYALDYPFGLLNNNKLGVFLKSSAYVVENINTLTQYVKCVTDSVLSEIQYPNTIYVTLSESMGEFNVTAAQMVQIYNKGVAAAELYLKSNPLPNLSN